MSNIQCGRLTCPVIIFESVNWFCCFCIHSLHFSQVIKIYQAQRVSIGPGVYTVDSVNICRMSSYSICKMKNAGDWFQMAYLLYNFSNGLSPLSFFFKFNIIWYLRNFKIFICREWDYRISHKNAVWPSWSEVTPTNILIVIVNLL